MECCSVACVHLQRPACWRGRGACEKGSEGGLRGGSWEPPPESPNDTPEAQLGGEVRGSLRGLVRQACAGRFLDFRGAPEVRRRSAAGPPEVRPRSRPSAHTFGEFAVVLTEGVRGRDSDRRCAWPILTEGVRGRNSGRRCARPILAEGMLGVGVRGRFGARQTLT